MFRDKVNDVSDKLIKLLQRDLKKAVCIPRVNCCLYCRYLSTTFDAPFCLYYEKELSTINVVCSNFDLTDD